MKGHEGAVVRLGVVPHRVLSAAAPSGYWLIPTSGGPIVRALVSRGDWRLAPEYRS